MIPAPIDEVVDLLRTLRLPHMRAAAPELLATAKAQRWEPAEAMRALLTEELAGRQASSIRARRKAAGFPTGKTFDLQTTVNCPAPSLRPHYRALTATTGRSAPVPRIGTLPLAVFAACGSPSRGQKPWPSLSGRQVLLFHASACDELTPPIHRAPPGPHTGSSPTEGPPWRAFVPGPPTDPGFDAIVVSFRCVSSGSHMFVFSSHTRPATARRHPQRSPPRLLTDAACGGLESPPARRPRRTYLHHWHSTDRADDLLHHHHHFPSGHTWLAETRPWRPQQVRRSRSWGPMCRVLYRLLVSLARLAVRSGHSKDLEIIVLRHQLAVLHRQNSRPALADEDRALLGAVAAALPRRQRAGWLVTPDTLLRWYRRRIAPTVRSISDHPSPPTLQTSQMGTSKSCRCAVGSR